MFMKRISRRHSPNRRKTRVEATALIDGALHRATILNVSLHGMGISVGLPLAPGTALTIRVYDAEIPTIVHWSHASHAGLHLLGRMDRDTLVALETAHDDLAEFR